MILGAFADIGFDMGRLEELLHTMDGISFKLEARKERRGDISGTKVTVHSEKEEGERNLADIERLIEGSGIPDSAKSLSISIFRRLAEAEAKVHGVEVRDVHFHEVGAVDSIVDIVGASICFTEMELKDVWSSPINVGGGYISSEHGMLPVPAPATEILLLGIPTFSAGPPGELTTPTGAAIISSVARGFGRRPPMRAKACGYGLGSAEREGIPNALRLTVGERIGEGDVGSDQVVVIEANIDDMNPEIFGYVSEMLFSKGALDVFLTPIIMKKGRPGTMISCIADPDNFEELAKLILTETTTLGVRMREMRRMKLDRETIEVETRWGDVRVKIGKLGDKITSISPEYEDCRRIAEDYGIPIGEVYEEARIEAWRIVKG
jgi:uncharacterized protein (TIGR00299 family) protein